MRAMSLVSSEGEGEQNEIRILQDKLSATMKLVSHLTAQLSELKEQVRPTSWPLLAAPAVPEAPACLPGGGEGGGACFLCPLPNLTNIFIKFLLKPGKGKIFPAVKALTCRLVFFSDF